MRPFWHPGSPSLNFFKLASTELSHSRKHIDSDWLTLQPISRAKQLTYVQIIGDVLMRHFVRTQRRLVFLELMSTEIDGGWKGIPRYGFKAMPNGAFTWSFHEMLKGARYKGARYKLVTDCDQPSKAEKNNSLGRRTTWESFTSFVMHGFGLARTGVLRPSVLTRRPFCLQAAFCISAKLLCCSFLAARSALSSESCQPPQGFQTNARR